MSHQTLKTSVNLTIQEILRSTIKLLCQKSIDFGLQLNIQGLIGITVDGAEVVLVNLQERIDKTNGGNATASTMSTALGANTDVQKKNKDSGRDNTAWSGRASQVKEETYDDDCIELTKNRIAPTLGLHLKQAHGDGDVTDHVAEFDDSYADEEEEDYTGYENEEQEYDETEYYDNGDDQYYEPTANDGYEQQQHSSTNFSQNSVARKRKIMPTNQTMHVVKRRPSKSRIATFKTEHDGGEDEKFYTGSNETIGSTSKMLPSEVHKVFTCSICGQTMRHASSFMRHKKQHDGTVYRCVCGKVFSRRDALTSHKRKCPTWAEQEPLHQQLGLE